MQGEKEPEESEESDCEDESIETEVITSEKIDCPNNNDVSLHFIHLLLFISNQNIKLYAKKLHKTVVPARLNKHT